MTAYTIRVLNQSSAIKSYAAFIQTPVATTGGGAPEVFANAWATFENVSQGGFDTVTYTESAGLTAVRLVEAAGAPAPVTTQDFTPTNDFMLRQPGNGSPIPSPVATFDTHPNEIYDITPVVKFFVADGLYQEGAVIDYSTASANSAVIDFSGTSCTTATVVQDDQGNFKVTYS